MGYHRDSRRFAAREVYQIQETLYEAIPCTYCGMPAGDEEHVFPRSYAASVPEILGIPYADPAIVPSCRECNSLSGRAIFTSIQEKRRYVHEKLKQRYRKILEIPQWTEEQLSELSPDLAHYVRVGLKQKAITLSRLRWQRGSGPAVSVGSLTSLSGPHKSFARQNAALRFITRELAQFSQHSKNSKMCVECHGGFNHWNAQAKYCSKACRKKAQRALVVARR